MEEAYFRNSLEYILGELSLLDMYLECAIIQLRNNLAKQDWNDYSGLYISDKEIDDLLSSRISLTNTATYPQNMQEAINRIRFEIKEKIAKSLRNGIDPSLIQLSRRLRLSNFERSTILICLAPELNSKYERIYAYLHNDVTKKRPTMGLILNLLCSSLEEKVQCRRFFTQSSKLFKFGILEFDRSQSGRELTHILSTPIIIDEHVTNLLLEHSGIDSRIEPFARLSYKNGIYKQGYDHFLYEDLKERVLTVLKSRYRQNHNDKSHQKTIFYFSAPAGSGKKTVAEEVCRDLGLPLLTANVYSASLNAKDFEYDIHLLFREALLQNAGLFLENFDLLLVNKSYNDGEYASDNRILRDSNSRIETILRHIEETPQQIIILSGESELVIEDTLKHFHAISVPFPELSQISRKKIWEELLKKCGVTDKIDIDDLSAKFQFTPGQIKSATLDATEAKLLKNDNIEDRIFLSSSDLYEACRHQSNRKLSSLARHIIPKHTLDDIILPRDKKMQLAEILSYVEYKNAIFQDWGFEKKLSLGKGLNILFAGQSGTGKSMAAEIIANELKLDLYRIDLSSIVSKYIGETEKNINRIFKEAESSNAILFFDEADAIFGKRSEVKDAHDRYANIEVNYLLQKLEEHREIVILASNLAKNIDDAFVRRMQFWIEFPFPDGRSRLMIWQKIFPDIAPLDATTVDFEFLAKQFSISGGVIKNIAIASAFLAKQSDSDIILMKHIITAVKREFDKMGKPCLKSEFEKYYDLISETLN